MGYETNFDTEVSGGETTVAEIAATLADELKDDAGYWESVLTGEEGPARWYDHTTDMIRVSARHPGVLITLRGQGEDPDDKWVEYHRDGRAHVEYMPEWVPPAFDPDKLQTIEEHLEEQEGPHA